jgi:hypothetical protein
MGRKKAAAKSKRASPQKKKAAAAKAAAPKLTASGAGKQAADEELLIVEESEQEEEGKAHESDAPSTPPRPPPEDEQDEAQQAKEAAAAAEIAVLKASLEEARKREMEVRERDRKLLKKWPKPKRRNPVDEETSASASSVCFCSSPSSHRPLGQDLSDDSDSNGEDLDLAGVPNPLHKQSRLDKGEGPDFPDSNWPTLEGPAPRV